MNNSDIPIWPAMRQAWQLAVQVARLPHARLCFDPALNPEEVRATYHSFTRPHPRYKVFRHKAIGAALLDLRVHSSDAAYLDSLRQLQPSPQDMLRRARQRGYVLADIDRNAYVDEIHAINTSLLQRQGRPMGEQYLRKVEHYEAMPNFRYLGVFNRDGRLCAYGNVGRYGNFAAFSQLLGLRNNDGIMHLLVASIAAGLVAERSVGAGADYLMYDTFFGAPPGLQNFKRMFGFQPYRVQYSLL